MTRIAVLTILAGLAGSQPALAASASVMAACRSDAIRLCRPVIYDEAKRDACMHAHAAELSKGCVAAVRADKAAGGQ